QSPAHAQGAAGSDVAAAPGVVLATATSASGSGGNFTATPLSEAGEWSTGGSSGAFTYSYPIQVPPVPGALQPSISLDYNSQGVDGLTSSTNNQASWIGDGWDYEPGYIERDYQSCGQNPSGPTKTGDLCWSSNDVTTLSLGGVTTTLVDDPVNGWHAEADNGYTVTYTTGSGANGTHDDDYWIVTAPDGTAYYFGLSELPGYASGDKATGSVFTAPVYATASGQPCYNATFSLAKCNQAWRWNLDWVTDPHGDAMAYYYQSETNYYAADNGTKATASYTQGGVPQYIYYGLRSSSGYGTPAAQVTFTASAGRTDVPTGSSQDLACASGAACSVISPTFWDKYQLTTIATSTLEGTTEAAVDSWTLHQEYLSTGATSPAPLWLDSITQATGETGSTPLVPPVVFGSTGAGMDNRVATATNLQDGYSMIPRNRIGSVTTETGGTITVTYDTPPSSCTSGSFPAADANKLLCYPVFWTPPNGTQREDWFNKYVVSAITQSNTVGGTVQVVTSYSYSGAAWHYDDDSLTRSSQRTWDQWRGFQTVTTETGDAAAGDPVTEQASTYFQGMNGDYQNGSPVTSASLTATVGGVKVTVTDSDQFAGTEFENVTYDGAGGQDITDTISTPWTSAATATQSQPTPLPALTAYMTGTAETQAFTRLASGGYREADVIYAHDSHGRVTSEASAPDAYDNGAAGDGTEDTCTQTTYTSSATLLTRPERVTVTSVPPSQCPVSGTPAKSALVSDTEDYYDGATSLTTAPTMGNVTEVAKATSYGTSEVFTPAAEATFDQYGRVLTALDANAIAAIAAGKTASPTSTTYTPATGAEPTTIKVTDPLGHATTTTYNPARELPLTVTNPAGWATTKTYDALGRLTAVWTPGHSTAGPADEKFSYTIPANHLTPAVVTTTSLDSAGNTLTSETLYDSLGRQAETQDETADGNTNITDIYYNSDGWQQVVSNAYTTSGLPTANLVAAPDGDVPSQTGYVYDGAGRVTRQIAYSLAKEEWETDTSYGGNYTTVTPPAGGTATTTYVNGVGKTSYIYQYHAATPPATPPAPGTASSAGPSGWDETAYTYTPAGQLKTVTDATGKDAWTYGYDLSGNQTSAADPDAGDTTSSYDPNGNLLSVTQEGFGASGSTTTSYTYDAANRKTAKYDTTGGAAEAGSDEVAAWSYDTLAAGQPYQSISYTGGTGGTSYTESVTGYNAYGLPQGTQVKVSAGTWAGTYKELYGYTTYADQLSTVSYPAAGGLPAETVSTGYDAADEPASLESGLWDYVTSTAYTELGQPQEYALGTTTEPAWIHNTYDEATNRLHSSEVQTGTTPVTIDNTTYTYENAGLITAEADTPANGPAQVQCFNYDYLGRLDAAWSQGTLPSTGCASTGPSGGSSIPASEAAAAAPYWEQYSYDVTGNLTSVTSTPPTGSATVTQEAFPAPGSTAYQSGQPAAAGQPPHAATGTGPQGFTTPATSYTYDQAGHLTSTTGSDTSQALKWNDQGQLSSVTTTGGATPGTTSYVYDAGSNLLLQTDGAADTASLYLPGETLTETTTGTTTYSSTRYYTLGGVTIAARTSAGNVDYLAGNQQGTATVAIDSGSLAVTYRYYDPYGNPVGSTPTAWPSTDTSLVSGGSGTVDTHGFVGGSTDTGTGLEDLGARQYNPASSSFISPDALLNPYDPQDLNAYAYSLDDPTSLSDPTGTSTCLPGDPCVEPGPPPPPPPSPCEMLGDCQSTYVTVGSGSGSGSGGTGGNGTGSSGNSSGDGSTPVHVSPHVTVETSDPYYSAMVAAYGRWVRNGPPAIARYGGVHGEFVGWEEICQSDKQACPAAFAAVIQTIYFAGISNPGIMADGDLSVEEDAAPAVPSGSSGSANETYYRGMSTDDYNQLVATGRLPSTSGETMISPTQGFSESYGDVLVKFALEPGTTDALSGIGVSDGTPNTVATYPDMPLVAKGWKTTNAYFKTESLKGPGWREQQINIGLGSGPGLDIFNDGIVGFDAVGGAP
ncbi:MAG: hypothetical protein JWN00_6001, partial [Actinomycetia bacterium]|nr:hypothetical protein [Actinomycetes bacterium]